VSELHDRLQQIARDVFDDDRLVLTDATVAGDVAGWDSLAHVNFMFSIEREFGVQFSEEEFVGFRDIGHLKRLLGDKLNGVSPAGSQ
jgi:acyl carrier protein